MNENNKSNIFIEFLMVNGWAIILVLVAITALIIFKPFGSLIVTTSQEQNKTYQEYVCDNLEKDINGTIIVFPQIIKEKSLIERDTIFRIVNINGTTSWARVWDTGGVMCEIDSEACSTTHNWCFGIKLEVPVNYTAWKEWYDK